MKTGLADNAIFFAADSADFCFDGHALSMSKSYQLFGLLDVLFDGEMGTVKHDAGESSVDAFQAAFIGAVVQVKSYGNGDALGLNYVIDHVNNRLVPSHVLSCALGALYDYRSLALLSSLQNSLCPLKVVEVESADGIVACSCSSGHFFCRY